MLILETTIGLSLIILFVHVAADQRGYVLEARACCIHPIFPLFCSFIFWLFDLLSLRVRTLEHPQCAVLAWSDTINAAIGPSPIHCGVDSMETSRLCIEPGSKLRPFLSLLPLLLPPPR